MLFTSNILDYHWRGHKLPETMAELIDTTTDQVHGEVRSRTDREEQSRVCEPCKVDNITQPAVGWCETCDELLCNDCYKSHCKPKLMRNHQLRSLEEMGNRRETSENTFTCLKHEGKRLTYFCEDHSELGCSKCAFANHRGCSKVVCISDVTTTESNELKALALLLCKLEKRIKIIDEKTEGNVSITGRQHDEAIAGIQEAGEKLKSMIDTLVKEQIVKADKVKDDNIRNISNVRETNEEIANKLSAARDMLAVEKGDNTRLFITMKHLQGEAKWLESKLYDSEQKSDIKAYEFVLNPEVTHLLETATELGTLKDKLELHMDKATDEVVDEFEVKRFQERRYIFGGWGYDGTRSDAIQMSSDRDIRLLYVLLYPCDSGDTNVELRIKEGDKCLISCTSTHAETDEDPVAVKVIGDGGVHGITLQAGHRYDVVVAITGYHSDYEYQGLAEVTVQGVKFTFSTSNKASRINVDGGQIPGFRFALL